MCGITGIYNYRMNQAVDRSLVEQMTDVLYHRGPDDAGYYFDDHSGIGFGHRRLSIIDLQSGKQPMSDNNGEIWITYNGELYNYLILKKQLEKDYNFKTKSDTEVIIYAYKRWGEKCFSRFNGIFSFSLWDSKDKKLILARDHIGVKPLYFYINNESLVFASEIKSILQYPNYSKNVDYEAINQLMKFRSIPAPNSPFKDIKKLKPGHIFVLEKRKHKIKRYWELKNNNLTQDELSIYEEFDNKIINAIESQMMSDVDIGIYLSGGLDSSLISNIVGKKRNNIQSFCAEFSDNTNMNEGKYAEYIASQNKMSLDIVNISSTNYIDNLNKYIEAIEEPINNFSGIAWLFLSQLVKQNNIKVILSGQGADELLGGYDKYLGEKYHKYVAILKSLSLDSYLTSICNKILPDKYNGNNQVSRAFNSLAIHNKYGRYSSILTIIDRAHRKSLLNKDVFIDSNFDYIIEERLKNVDFLDNVNQLMYLDTQIDLPDNLLLIADKVNMYNSVELRVPFLDINLIEYSLLIPSSQKVKYFRKKYFYKKYLRKYFNKNFVNRRKIGFHSPINSFFRNKNFVQYFRNMIYKPNSFSSNYLNLNFINMLLDDHINMKSDNKFILHQILILELWHEKYFI